MSKYVRKGHLNNENVRIVEVCEYGFSVVLDLSYKTSSVVYAKTIIPKNFCEVLGVKEVVPFHPFAITQEFILSMAGYATEVGVESGKMCFGWKANFDDDGNVVGADIVEWKVFYKFGQSKAEVSELKVIDKLPEGKISELKRLLAKKYGKCVQKETKYLVEENPLAQSLIKEYSWLNAMTFGRGYNLTVVPLCINGQVFGAKVVWKNALPIYLRGGVVHDNELRYISKEEFDEIPN